MLQIRVPDETDEHWSRVDPNTFGWRRALPTLFDGVNDVDANTALRRFETRLLEPGDVLCREGEAATELTCVRSGRLEVRSNDQLLGHIMPDDLVGEMGLFEDSRRTATVTATESTEVLVLTCEGYEELRATVHPIVRNIERAAMELQVSRLRATGERVAQLVKGTPVEPVSIGERFRAGVRRLFGPGGMFSTSDADPFEALGRSELFADVPEAFLREIAACFRPAAYREGQLLCTQDEPGDWMFILDQGEVDVVLSNRGEDVIRVATLAQGSAFGMVAMVVPGDRMASVIARTPVVVHALGVDGWSRLMLHPWGTGSAFRRAVIKAFGAQLAATNAQVVAYEKGHDVDALQLAKARLA